MNYIDIDFPCKRCNINNAFKIYKMINIDKEKELYKKIDNKTIFNYKCPKCGFVDLIMYSFICYSKKRKFAILYSKETDTNNRKHELRDFGIDNIKNIDEYTTRTVNTLEDLNEKISMFEHGLSDAIIEVAKIWFISTSDVKIDELRFYKIEDDFIKWFVYYDNKIKGARLPMDFYRESLEDWIINIPSGFPEINKETLDKYLKRKE